MKDDDYNHPLGTHRYVTPIVAAESHGRTGDVFTPPYKSARATPADHTVEDDTYDWKHQAPLTLPPELHFDERNPQVTEWVWWGIGLQLALVPTWAFSLIIYVMASYNWGTLILTAPLLTLSIAGLASSIRSLIYFRRSPNPMMTLCLGLIGLALGLIFALYFAPDLLQRASVTPNLMPSLLVR
jgi:hypothetical protein